MTQDPTLTDMAMGYSRSRMLCAAARLGIADALGDQTRSVSELAATCGAHPTALYRLLRALASFGVVAETTSEHFMLMPLGKPLRKDAPNSQWAAVVFWADLLADSWSYLTECVRTGDNAARIMEREHVASRWSKDPNARAIFGAVMGTAPAEDYLPLAKAWDFSQRHVVADLGGGGGALMVAVLNAYPGLRGMVVDRPEYIETAKARIVSEGLTARCEAVGCDLRQSVPAGADVHMLKHVLHGYEDAAANEILRHCRSALPANGRLLVIEFVLPDVVDRVDPQLERRLMSDLNMMAVTGGRERSAVEWKRLLSNAGFECHRITLAPGDLVSILEARPRG